MKRSTTINSSGDTPTAKRKRLTIAEKREVISMLKKGSSNSQVAEHFQIGLSTVRGIKKTETSLDSYQISFGSPSNSERKSLKRPKDYVDQVTFTWFKSQRAAGAQVNGMMLQIKALEFNRLLKGPESFKAARGWLNRFLSRHGIKLRNTSGAQGGAEVDSAQEFCWKNVPELVKVQTSKYYSLFICSQLFIVCTLSLFNSYNALASSDKYYAIYLKTLFI
jgi:transposase